MQNQVKRKDKQSVCIVAPVHMWDDVRVFQKEARTLAQAGYDVSLIARSANSTQQSKVKIIPSVGSSDSRIIRFLLLPVVGIQALLNNADIYHLHNPDTLPIAILLKSFGKTVIYDTHEDFTKRILARDWIPTPLRGLLAYTVGIAEIFISKIVNATIATQDAVVKRLGRNALLLGNPPRTNESLYATVSKRAAIIHDDNEKHYRAIYIGSISKSRGLNEMVDALKIANKVLSVRLWLIGPANNQDLEYARGREGWKYVDYIPKMAQEDAFAYICRSNVGFVIIHDVGDHSSTDPNKLYEYMMFGVPFIASEFESWMNKLSAVDAGWFVNPEDPHAIAARLIKAAKEPQEATNKGRHGAEYTKTYNWEIESKKLLQLYRAI